MAEPLETPKGRAGKGQGAGGATGPYQVVARRFRPKAFGEMVGQDAIQATLRAELESGRIPHAFLFAGSRGVGKTTTARILARCLNCEQGPTAEPCGTCALCTSILDGSNPDVIEIDAASNNGVDDVRALRDRIAFAPMMSRYKVYILDEAHMLSKAAWNALLKTLEEPPPRVVLVLATTELHKVIDTVRSRCQVLQFRRIGDDDIVERLRMIVASEGVAIPDEVLAEIAASSKGGMRDAETALERALQLARDHDGAFDLGAYRELVQRLGVDRAIDVAAALLQGDAATGLRFCRELQDAGADEREALGDLVDALRAVMVLQVDGADTGLISYSGSVRQRLQELAQAAPRPRVEAMIQAGVLGRERLRRLEDRAAILELAIVRMAEAGTLPTLAELVAAARDGSLRTIAPPATADAGRAAPAATAASPRSAVAAGGAGGADLRAQVLHAARDEHLLHATLELCSFVGPDAAGRVIVATDTERKMHRDRLQSPQVQDKLRAWLQQATGAPVTIEVRLAEPRGDGPPPDAPPPGATAQRVLQRFGGRVVGVNPDDRVAPATGGANGGANDGDEDAPPPPDDDA
ncbi:MAG: DNA polymerase III subunit gamma/tau [Planctomycetota bacterium]